MVSCEEKPEWAYEIRLGRTDLMLLGTAVANAPYSAGRQLYELEVEEAAVMIPDHLRKVKVRTLSGRRSRMREQEMVLASCTSVAGMELGMVVGKKVAVAGRRSHRDMIPAMENAGVTALASVFDILVEEKPPGSRALATLLDSMSWSLPPRSRLVVLAKLKALFQALDSALVSLCATGEEALLPAPPASRDWTVPFVDESFPSAPVRSSCSSMA